MEGASRGSCTWRLRRRVTAGYWHWGGHPPPAATGPPSPGVSATGVGGRGPCSTCFLSGGGYRPRVAASPRRDAAPATRGSGGTAARAAAVAAAAFCRRPPCPMPPYILLHLVGGRAGVTVGPAGGPDAPGLGVKCGHSWASGRCHGLGQPARGGHGVGGVAPPVSSWPTAPPPQRRHPRGVCGGAPSTPAPPWARRREGARGGMWDWGGGDGGLVLGGAKWRRPPAEWCHRSHHWWLLRRRRGGCFIAAGKRNGGGVGARASHFTHNMTFKGADAGTDTLRPPRHQGGLSSWGQAREAYFLISLHRRARWGARSRTRCRPSSPHPHYFSGSPLYDTAATAAAPTAPACLTLRTRFWAMTAPRCSRPGAPLHLVSVAVPLPGRRAPYRWQGR